MLLIFTNLGTIRIGKKIRIVSKDDGKTCLTEGERYKRAASCIPISLSSCRSSEMYSIIYSVVERSDANLER